MNKISVTIPEAIQMTGIGRSSLYKLFNEGRITPRKLGKRVLILVEELERFIKALPTGLGEETETQDPRTKAK